MLRYIVGVASHLPPPVVPSPVVCLVCVCVFAAGWCVQTCCHFPSLQTQLWCGGWNCLAFLYSHSIFVVPQMQRDFQAYGAVLCKVTDCQRKDFLSRLCLCLRIRLCLQSMKTLFCTRLVKKINDAVAADV